MVEIEKLGIKLNFNIPDSLFSPKGLDRGSSLLIDQLKNISYKTALDWGCGWGAIALFMAANKPTSKVWALDAHVGAVNTTKENSALNNLSNIVVVASDSYHNLAENLSFDLIVANPPTHMGRKLVDDMISQSVNWLNNDGSLLLVVETRLKPWIIRDIRQVYGNYKILAKTNKNIVFSAQKKL